MMMLKRLWQQGIKWLQKNMESVDPVVRMYLSAILVVFMAFFSLGRVGQLFAPARQGTIKQPVGIRFPTLQQAGKERDRSGNEIKAFESFLDSLRADSAGRKAFDELQKKEPGLAETLRQMENKLR